MASKEGHLDQDDDLGQSELDLVSVRHERRHRRNDGSLGQSRTAPHVTHDLPDSKMLGLKPLNPQQAALFRDKRDDDSVGQR